MATKRLLLGPTSLSDTIDCAISVSLHTVLPFPLENEHKNTLGIKHHNVKHQLEWVPWAELT